ncbi:MAG: hypothetical protein ACKVY0_25535 [Prosthecobacter sp.]|uniref:hypothetical protein n=1 Tax=Prosthecobacter sp. TaxID=1965333 RepID=UPI0038FD7FDD
MKRFLVLLAAATGTALSQTSVPPRDDDAWLREWVREIQFYEMLGRTSADAGPSREVAQRDNRSAGDARSMSSASNTLTDWPAFWSQGKAKGKGPVRLTHLPMRVEDIKMFTPYGLMVGGHVCPIDHCYFYPKDGVTVDVVAPADGFIAVLGHRTQLTGSSERGREYDDYAVTIEHSGTFYSQYDLLTSLDPLVLDALDATTRDQMTSKTTSMPQTHVRIPVKAGQVIGKVGGRSLDFGVVNFETKLTGFISPSLYGHYSWRVHLVSPFDYLDEPLNKTLQKLSARKAEPLGGKIDYDIDGKLVGNWFREGSGGYPGDRNDPRGYWMGHLAIAYHHIDLTKIVVSIGDFGGKPAQYWVKGNKPDPATIGEKDGVVKYELVYGQIGSDGKTYEGISTGVQGTVLVQVLPGRKTKFEAFPGQKGREVKGFTENAKTYER